jgi:peptidoglycan/LPS O-acetylase OafA/YrhL
MSDLTTAAPRERKRIRLEYLDGLRGLSAVYVTAFHAWLCWTMSGGYSSLAYYSSAWISFGRQAVAVFIVLSGYCLMLPIVRAVDQSLPGGALEYFKRRAWRILPPYYAALALSLAAMAVLPLWIDTSSSWWGTMEPAFGTGNLIGHVLLVHNLSDEWVFKINSPMWSVAMEWQIYFLFPLVLLPVWRRAGIFALIVTALAIGLFPVLVLKRLAWTAPWFVGHFAVGMAGAAIGFSADEAMVMLRRRIPWGALTAIGTLAFLAISVVSLRASLADWKYVFLTDVIVGGATISLMIYCTRYLTDETSDSQRPVALRVLESPFAAFLGRFSYSLYLIHAPVVGGVHVILRQLGVSSNLLFWGMMLVSIPVSLAAAYGFYLLFEKPVLERRKARARETVSSATAVPDAAA